MQSLSPNIRIAQSGSKIDRWELAGREGLSREVFELLASDTDLDVLLSLSANYTTPEDLLDRMATANPLLRTAIALNPNAAPALKEEIPIGSDTQDSLNRFIEACQMTAIERQRISQEYDESPHPGGRRLGEVWAEIRRS